MIDYFELYKTCLKIIAERHPDQTCDFMEIMKDEDIIVSELSKGTDSRLLVLATFQVLDNLIDDSLIKASKQLSKTHDPIYMFYGVSTTGYQYLKSLEDPMFSEKLKTALKNEGIPMTPNAITKFIAKLTL